MSYVHEDECEYVGLKPTEVARVARNLDKWLKEADKLGVYIFCGAGTTLRKENYVVAVLDAHNSDGGDGAWKEDENGLMVGES